MFPTADDPEGARSLSRHGPLSQLATRFAVHPSSVLATKMWANLGVTGRQSLTGDGNGSVSFRGRQ